MQPCNFDFDSYLERRVEGRIQPLERKVNWRCRTWRERERERREKRKAKSYMIYHVKLALHFPLCDEEEWFPKTPSYELGPRVFEAWFWAVMWLFVSS